MAKGSQRRLRLRSVDLSEESLPFEPENEAGVVMVFGRYAEQLGFHVLNTRGEFPDCRARYADREVRIEFEYRSRNFQTHDHDPRKCDLVVCWQHYWPDMPRRYEHLEILELRKLFGLGWQVWVQPMEGYYADQIPGGNRYTEEFSVPSQAGPDDLLLIYRPRPDMQVRDVVRVASPVQKTWAGWKDDWDWMADYQRVASLTRPLSLDDIAAAVRKPRASVGRSFQGRPKVTGAWPALRERILRTNPELKSAFEKYGPSRAEGR